MIVSRGFWICARGEINRRFESPPGTRRDQGWASPFLCAVAATCRRQGSPHQSPANAKTQIPEWVSAFLELLGRFELPDSFADRLLYRAPRVRSAVRTPTYAKTQIPEWVSAFLELLGRFELPTSSLPRMRSTY